MKVGVLGIGYWGSKVAPEYIQLAEEELVDSVAICDLDESNLDGYEAKKYTDLDSFLDEVDAVHICTGNSTHFETAKKALQKDVNVLVEKPIVENPKNAYKLIELAGERDLILQSGHIFRFANITRKLKELVQDGRFGETYYYDLRWTHKMEPVEGRDVVWDLLPHPLDIVHFIEGEWPQRFSGKGHSFRRDELSEVAFIDAEYDGFEASIELSWCDPVKRRVLQINGSKASAVAHCVKQELKIYEDGEEKEVEIDDNNTIRDEALNFVEAVKSNKNNYNPAVVGARAVESISKAIEEIDRDEQRSRVLQDSRVRNR